jgi:hypothetical protein
VIFCIYSDPENPFYAINSVEGHSYYLHEGETEGTYAVERAGSDVVFAIQSAGADGVFDFDVLERAMDPAGRLILEMIPFAQYK